MSNRKEPLKYWLLKAGPHDFYRHGREYFQFLKHFCNLQPNERILDVGCDMGRLAVPVTKYLNKEGMYEGNRHNAFRPLLIPFLTGSNFY